MKCKSDIMTYTCDGLIHYRYRFIVINIIIIDNLRIWLNNLTIKKILKNIIKVIRSGCLNLWYIKNVHLNVMKFTAFTKYNLGVLYMKFLSNWNNLPTQYNFTFD